MKTNGDGKSLWERFEIENDRILQDARTADREARAKIAEHEKALGQAKSKREKAVSIFEKMRADFERIENETMAAEMDRLTAAAKTKEDVLGGTVSFEEYFREGKTRENIDFAARAETAKKLGDLLQTVRAKSLEVLELDVEVATCERELSYLRIYPTSFMLERMRAQLKSLEQTVTANAGGCMPLWTEHDIKKAALNRARGKAISGHTWDSLDVAAAKQLRFDAGIPESEIPKLNEIIAEMETRPGCTVSLKYVAMPHYGKGGLSVSVWRTK